MVSKIFMICDAYESGFGHGLQMDGHRETLHGDPNHAEAYQLGYDNGAARAQERPEQEDQPTDLEALRLAILNIPASAQAELLGKDSTTGMAYSAGHFSARMAAARLVDEYAGLQANDKRDAARYRYWRNNACRRPGMVANALATAIFDEQIDAAIDWLLKTQPEKKP